MIQKHKKIKIFLLLTFISSVFLSCERSGEKYPATFRSNKDAGTNVVKGTASRKTFKNVLDASPQNSLIENELMASIFSKAKSCVSNNANLCNKIMTDLLHKHGLSRKKRSLSYNEYQKKQICLNSNEIIDTKCLELIEQISICKKNYECSSILNSDIKNENLKNLILFFKNIELH